MISVLKRHGGFYILVTPPIVLTFFAVSTVHRMFDYLTTGPHLAEIIAKQATTTLNREVLIRNVSFSNAPWIPGTNRVTLTGVYVGADKKTHQPGLGNVKSIRITYNSNLLLATNKTTPPISQIVVSGPTISLDRSKTGVWNFASLIHPSTKPSSPIISSLVVLNGTLHYRDHDFPHTKNYPSPVLNTSLHSVALTLHFRPDGSIQCKGDGYGNSSLLQHVSVDGVIHTSPLRFVSHINVQKLGLITVADLLPTLRPKGKLLSGTADADVDILYNPGTVHTPLQVNGQIVLQHLGVSIKGLNSPVTDINGPLMVIADAVSGSLTGNFAGSRIAIQGRAVGIPYLSRQASPYPYVTMNGSLRDLNYARIYHAINVARLLRNDSPYVQISTRQGAASGMATFELNGFANNPTGTLNASFKKMKWGVYTASNVGLHAYLLNHNLLADVDGDAASGKVKIRSTVHLAHDGIFKATAHGRGLNLAYLERVFHTPMQGTGNADVAILGRVGRTPHISTQLLLSNVSYNHQTLAQVYLRASSAARRLLIHNFSIDDTKGYIHASGVVNLAQKRYNLALAGDDLNLNSLLQASKTALHLKTLPVIVGPDKLAKVPLIDVNQLEGLGYMRAHLSGTFQDPNLNGGLVAIDLKAGRLSLVRVGTHFDVTRNQVALSKGSIVRYPGVVDFSGNIDNYLSSSPSIVASVQASKFDIGDLMQLADVQIGASGSSAVSPILGTLSSSPIEIEGPLKSPYMLSPATLTLNDGSMNGIPITTAALSAYYSPMHTFQGYLNVQMAGGSLSLISHVNTVHNLSATYSVNGMQIQQLLTAATGSPDEKITGLLNIQGTASGTLTDPVASASININSLHYLAFNAGDLSGTLTATGKELGAQALTLTLAQNGISSTGTSPGKLSIENASYNLTTRQVNGNATWTDIPLDSIRSAYLQSKSNQNSSLSALNSFLKDSNTTLSGGLSGSLQLSGLITNPTASLSVSGKNLVVGGVQIDSIDASASGDKNHIVMPALGVQGPALRVLSPLGIVLANSADLTMHGAVSGNFGLYNLNVGAVARALPISFSPTIEKQINGLSGQGDLTCSVSGDLKSPVVEASAQLSNLQIGGQKIDQIVLSRAVIQQPKATVDLITISRSYTRQDGSRGTFSGNMHGSFGFQWHAPYLSRTAPIDLSANIPSQKIQDLAALVPGISIASDGTVAAQADLTNTLEDPLVTGSVQVDAKKLQFGLVQSNQKPSFIATGLSNIHGKLLFNGSKLSVAPGFTAQAWLADNTSPGKEKQGSPITLTGSLPIIGRGDGSSIQIAAKQLLFNQSPIPGFGSGVARGEAQLTFGIAGSLVNPDLTGNVNISNAFFSPPTLTTGGQGSSFALPVLQHLKLGVALGKNVTISASGLDAQVEGLLTLTAQRTTTKSQSTAISSPIHLAGQLVIKQGVLSLPTARFKVLPPGLIDLTYPVYSPATPASPTLGVHVNVRAQTALDLPSPGFSGEKRYNVVVTARGDLSGATENLNSSQQGLQLDFQTNPPDYSGDQKQLMTQVANALGIGAIANLGHNTGQVITQQITSVLANSVLPTLFEKPAQALGFEDLSVNYDPLRQFSFTLTRQLIGPFYITYTRDLGSTQQFNDLKLSWRFSDNLQLSYEQNEQYDKALQLEGIYRF